MPYSLESALSRWESFYVIVGTSAAALTGLQFVVMTLVAEHLRPRDNEGVDAFGTPTVVHFCASLMVSALLSAPWPSETGLDVALGVVGLAGLAYTGVVFRRARRQKGYQPVFEDWLWHVALPAVAYASLLAVSPVVGHASILPLFVIGGAALALLAIGIHNAWDTVVYVVTRQIEDAGGAGADSEKR
jgi:hypothetical protein